MSQLIFLLIITTSFLSMSRGEMCEDSMGGYCTGEGDRGCCIHGQPMCCGAGHANCVPRLGLNYGTQCPDNTACSEGNVCMLLGGPGKDKCVPEEVRTCNNYLRFEGQSKCGNNGYPLGYGLKYCQRFFQYYDEFNEEGQKFIKCVGNCLVDKMTTIVQDASDNCTALRIEAYDSHTPCYKDCGFTKRAVYLRNVFKFAKVIDTGDLFSAEGLKQIKQLVLAILKEEIGIDATTEEKEQAQKWRSMFGSPDVQHA